MLTSETPCSVCLLLAILSRGVTYYVHKNCLIIRLTDAAICTANFNIKNSWKVYLYLYDSDSRDSFTQTALTH